MGILDRAPEILDAIERRRNYCTLNDKSQFSHGCIYADVMDAADLIRAMQSELARVQKERDAAIEDLHGVCNACKHYSWPHNKGACASCENDIRIGDEERTDMWEWRGVKEDNDGTPDV